MPKNRSWVDDDLIKAVAASQSYRSVLIKLSLIPAGGNYDQVKKRISELSLSTEHFTGQGWNRGWQFDPRKPRLPLTELLVIDRPVQSHKLRLRLIAEGIKEARCELCGWNQSSPDGRLPLELDHLNGNPNDNRLENLRILCPNCHSLQPTHRGKNKKVRLKYGRVLERFTEQT
jgi:5-methylcytosine-specific restriction endonuclease McrA